MALALSSDLALHLPLRAAYGIANPGPPWKQSRLLKGRRHAISEGPIQGMGQKASYARWLCSDAAPRSCRGAFTEALPSWHDAWGIAQKPQEGVGATIDGITKVLRVLQRRTNPTGHMSARICFPQHHTRKGFA